MRRSALVAAILLAGLTSGCISDRDDGVGFDTLTVRVRNEGGTTMHVPFTITADGKTVFAETLPVGGGATVERSIPAVGKADYLLRATYKADNGGQHVDGGRTHTLEHDDCARGTVLVTFAFVYTSSPGMQRFNSGGSAGTCLDD